MIRDTSVWYIVLSPTTYKDPLELYISDVQYTIKKHLQEQVILFFICNYVASKYSHQVIRCLHYARMLCMSKVIARAITLRHFEPLCKVGFVDYTSCSLIYKKRTLYGFYNTISICSRTEGRYIESFPP